jgi:hypothetical protein
MLILMFQVTISELRIGVLMGKSVGRHPFATKTRTWKDNNKIGLKRMICEDPIGKELLQNCVQWRVWALSAFNLPFLLQL